MQQKSLFSLSAKICAVMTLWWCVCGMPYAEAELIQPENPSNNVVEVDANSYTINGVKNSYDAASTYGNLVRGGFSFVSGQDAFNNTLRINGINGGFFSLVGGHATYGNASYNKLTITNSDIRNTTNSSTSSMYSNLSNGGIGINTIGNEVVLNNSTVGHIIGGLGAGTTNSGTIVATGKANDNSITQNGGQSYYLLGGESSGEATGNTVTVNDGKVMMALGANAYGADASDNVVNINNSTVTSSIASDYGESTIHTVDGQEITVGSYVIGAIATNGNALRNIVNINGGSIEGNISAASAYYQDVSSTTSGISTPNNISITDNVINIRNHPTFNNVNLYGWYSTETTNVTHSGNALNIYTKNLNAQSISNFDNINFYMGTANVQNGDTMLTVNSADLTDTTVTGIVDGNTSLKDGDKVTLLSASNITESNTTYDSNIYQGISFAYPVTVAKDGNSIIATVGASSGSGDSTEGGSDSSSGDSSGGDSSSSGSDASSGDSGSSSSGGSDSASGDSSSSSGSESSSSGGSSSSGDSYSGGSSTGGSTYPLQEQTNVLPATVVTAPKMVMTHMESTINWLPPDDFGASSGVSSSGTDTVSGSATENESSTQDNLQGEGRSESSAEKQLISASWEPLANIGTSNLTTDTGNGSKVKSRTNGIDVGLARVLNYRNGSKLHIAPIFDYGGGSYDSYLNDGTHGSGNTHFFMGGIIGRKTLDNGFYFEGSFRTGTATMDFKSDDLTQGSLHPHVTYTAKAKCWAGHIHLGRNINFSPVDKLNIYGMYFHTHQGSMDTRLSTSEEYHFGSVTNRRIRIGARLTRQVRSDSRVYSGIAYQWESVGAVNGICDGKSTDNVGVSGSSGMLELGWQYKPLKESPWTVDVGAVGWVGHQRGFSAQAKLKMAF